jgi:hypothetical protein
MDTQGSIRRAQSCAVDARDAVREFHAEVAQANMALVLFFCSNEYDLDVVAAEMERLFAGVKVVGCTTAGEIGPAGYCEHSITGASFAAAAFTAVVGHLEHLQKFEEAQGQAFVHAHVHTLQRLSPQAGPHNSFALLLIDGMSVREEPVTRTLQDALDRLPLIGGSAADGLRFGNTYVYFRGRFHADSALMVLLTTQLPFNVFKIQHFVPTAETMVVTEADTAQRIVSEINGVPAAEEYARLIGVEVSGLDPARFAASPVVVLIDGMNYVRSIQKANADGSLTFFCAIDEGLVLRLARGEDLVANMDQSFAAIRSEIGVPQLVIGCDCILRKVEIGQTGINDRVAAVFENNNAIGFSTYGEQFRGIHINQTLTGIAIGPAATEVRSA